MATVYLSPSLQQWNVGAGNYGTEEQRMNQLADIVEYELDRHGVVIYRNTPEMTLAETVQASNAVSPDVHVALHSNASANGVAQGPTVYVHRFGGPSEGLADQMYENLAEITPTPGFGVKEGYQEFQGQGMYELRRTAAPAVLAEVIFHDNPEDAAFFIDHIYEMGNQVAKAVLSFFDIAYSEDTPENIAYLQSVYNGSMPDAPGIYG